MIKRFEIRKIVACSHKIAWWICRYGKALKTQSMLERQMNASK
jgi:hypothetical protein